MKIHWGRPRHPSGIKATTCWSHSNEAGWRSHIVWHQISNWYGISFGSRWWLGLQTFGPPITRIEPLPSCDGCDGYECNGACAYPAAALEAEPTP